MFLILVAAAVAAIGVAVVIINKSQPQPPRTYCMPSRAAMMAQQERGYSVDLPPLQEPTAQPVQIAVGIQLVEQKVKAKKGKKKKKNQGLLAVDDVQWVMATPQREMVKR